MPSVRLAVALPVLRVARPYGPGAPPIIAAAPGAGTTRWPSWSCCRPNTRPGSLHCQRRSRTRPPPRRCTQSATSTSQTSKRSSRREASAGIKPARLCGTVGDRLSRQHHQHRSRKDVGAARRPYAYGAGPTGSADPNHQRGSLLDADLECAPWGGQIGRFELTPLAGLPENGSHDEASIP